MTENTPLVRVRGAHKHFTRGSERIDVLKGVQLEIPAGDYLALMEAGDFALAGAR